MLQLIYSSAATVPFTTTDLNQLLERARARNALFNVSGMLLYHSGSFLQVIEGPESGIDIIYRSIARDPRHTGQRILMRQQIPRREFQGWSMGFADTSQHYPAGFVDYHRDLPALADASSRAAQFLRFFQQGLCRQTA